MNLEALKSFQEAMGEWPKKDRAEAVAASERAIEGLEGDLPALSEYDRAMVALYVASLMQQVLKLPLAEATGILDSSSIAYGVAALKLLGWDTE